MFGNCVNLTLPPLRPPLRLLCRTAPPAPPAGLGGPRPTPSPSAGGTRPGRTGGGWGGGRRTSGPPSHPPTGSGRPGVEKTKTMDLQKKKSVKACSLQTLLKSFFSHTSDLLNVRTIAPATRSTRSFTRSEKWPIIFKKPTFNY